MDKQAIASCLVKNAWLILSSPESECCILTQQTAQLRRLRAGDKPPVCGSFFGTYWVIAVPTTVGATIAVTPANIAVMG